jgi:hypothetical protein
MKMRFKILSITLSSALLFSVSTSAQVNLSGAETGSDINTITTAVPFLLISPDSRSGAMGDVGVALSPDANSIHWNPAKLAFIDDDKDMGFSLSYSPWLRALVNDINLAYLSGYKKLDKNSAIGFSLRYFSLGDITFTNNYGQEIRNFKPNEFALDGTYSRKLGERFGAGIAARYIYSNLTGGISSSGADVKAGQSVAVDISAYYETEKFELSGKDANVAYGLNISNIGAKMSYTDAANRDFIPTNLRLGTAFNVDLDEFNKLTVALDANKLLVPTQPVYMQENGSTVYGTDGPIIFSGKDPNVGVASGIFGSFSDAPGDVLLDENGNTTEVVKGTKFKEELREVNISVGAEYLYNNLLAIRAGYFHEHWSKGNRRFMSLGAGIRYSVFELDLSYILALTQASPLANTLRFTLRFNFGEVDSESSI